MKSTNQRILMTGSPAGLGEASAPGPGNHDTRVSLEAHPEGGSYVPH